MLETNTFNASCCLKPGTCGSIPQFVHKKTPCLDGHGVFLYFI